MMDDPHVCGLCDEFPCTCHTQEPLALACPECGSDDLDVVGVGVGQVRFRCGECGEIF